MADVRVQVQRLPGVGWRYTVPADQGRQLIIVVEDAGPRHLVLVDPWLDNPLATVRLSDTLSSVVAALLAGARFHIEYPHKQVTKDREPDQAVVEVLEIRSGSPAVGRLPDDVIRELGFDAALLIVTRDRTAEPVETNAQRPIEVGDNWSSPSAGHGWTQFAPRSDTSLRAWVHAGEPHPRVSHGGAG
ncbi:MAG: hypothetical protein M3460_18930 [Actinomycetota bacterium]|nr:hypothetical protein [Actinomycetota bacterium]